MVQIVKHGWLLCGIVAPVAMVVDVVAYDNHPLCLLYL